MIKSGLVMSRYFKPLAVISKKTFAGEEYKGKTEERTVILAVVDQAFWKKFLLMEFHKPE